MNRWWEDDTPQVITTRTNVLRYYPKAGKLQVSRPDWITEEGETRPGKTVTLDVAALQQDAAEIFEAIAERVNSYV